MSDSKETAPADVKEPLDVSSELGQVSEEHVQTKRTLKQKILGVIWDSLDKTPEERAFVHKADCWILTYVCLAYFVKYLDQTNIVNAYVSGMKEDLDMSGNQYNYLITMFTVGYCLGNLPSQIIMTKIRPSIWLPALELTWGILVMAMAAARNIETLYALRFFIGLLEASAYPGILTLLGNWYTPSELGKRSCIFFASSSIAQMFSGYLQAGLLHGMDGRLGLAAWQWLFIFDGIIGTPIALIGFFAIPDSPTNSKARWLKPEEKQMAIARMERVGRRPPGKLTWGTFRDILTDWPVYVFSLAFSGQLCANRVLNYFSIYLKSTNRYTAEQVNLIPTGGFGFQVVCCLAWAWISDATGKRAPVIACAASVSLIGAIILSVWPERNIAAMMTGWFLEYAHSGASALIFSYLNEILSFSSEQRLVVIGIVETCGFVMTAWVILVAYNTSEAPHFSVGYEMTAMFFGIYIVSILAAYFLEKIRKPKGSTAS